VLRLRFGALRGDDVLELLLQLVGDHREGADRDLVVGDVLLLEVGAAGELVEVVARLHLGPHLPQHGGRRVDALLGEAHVAGVARLALRGSAHGHLVDGGAVPVQGSGLGILGGTGHLEGIGPQSESDGGGHEEDYADHQQTSFQLGATAPPVGVPVEFTNEYRLVGIKSSDTSYRKELLLCSVSPQLSVSLHILYPHYNAGFSNKKS